MMEDFGRLEYERTGKTLAVAMSGRCAVEVLLSLLGDLVDVGVLVFGRHGDVVSVWSSNLSFLVSLGRFVFEVSIDGWEGVAMRLTESL
jgi:hypothetical protein